MTTFTDAEDTREHTVYRCYDAEDQLLYIGCTSDLDSRLSLHNPLILRHTRVVSTETYPDRLTGRAAERAAIEAEGPLMNKQHNPLRFTPTVDSFVPVEPVHPLTAELIRQRQPVSMDDMRSALEKVAELLGLNDAKWGAA